MSTLAPLRIILVGDSTMATRTGYGDALGQRLNAAVDFHNLGRGGRSTKTYREEGLWDEMLALLKQTTPCTTYVLIQFGHNDQPWKVERATDLATEFPANLTRYVDETRSAGAIPVLVTPLTRRYFDAGVLLNDLRPWAEATLRVAAEKQVPVIDLNAVSYAAVAAIGSVEADTLAEEPPPTDPMPEGVKSRFDYTHVGAKGGAFFAQMMQRQMMIAIPEVAKYFLRDD